MAHVGRCGWPGMHEVCCSAGGWFCGTKSSMDDRCQDKTGRLLQAWVSGVLKFVAAILRSRLQGPSLTSRSGDKIARGIFGGIFSAKLRRNSLIFFSISRHGARRKWSSLSHHHHHHHHHHPHAAVSRLGGYLRLSMTGGGGGQHGADPPASNAQPPHHVPPETG
ncbi:hypothetical protein COCVIDRAFT_14673 [Bipolaris victoriae FI3]|uniref:Uncharacterized protein n=1 Tax=Bipolaris victoriae (strain FI3) TaxID=930091 RepID=W7ENQ8_BIPV3|nr:hypothetical protein COCVIDRAFT_14673 [Bipolaris victoriae FI3]